MQKKEKKIKKKNKKRENTNGKIQKKDYNKMTLVPQ